MSTKTQVVVLAVLRKNDKFLLTKRNDPHSEFHNKWQLVGGGNEFAETPLETLHREVREELGIEVAKVSLIPFIDTKVRGGWHGIFISYACEMKNINDPIIINDEASEFGWFTLEEARALDMIQGSHVIMSARERT